VRSVDGRGDACRAHDVTTAVALIESWSRADLEAPLLVPHTAPLAPPPEPRATPVYVGGLIASSLASDDSLWFDATVNACAELGPFCLGGLLRASFDTAEFGASEHVETNRVGLDLMATAELPIAIAGTTLAPGISLGGGWLRSISDVDATPDPREIDRGTMRFGAQLRLSAPAGERVFIDTGAFVDLLPLAHTTEFVDGGVTLAGEPRWFARLGFGVRYAVQP
ncbi:MAG: hypothetical protein KC620_24475, partial [Myxococcales bacterium]|nr:hypothetical protein [Myxococcales bacterium]